MKNTPVLLNTMLLDMYEMQGKANVLINQSRGNTYINCICTTYFDIISYMEESGI